MRREKEWIYQRTRLKNKKKWKGEENGSITYLPHRKCHPFCAIFPSRVDQDDIPFPLHRTEYNGKGEK